MTGEPSTPPDPCPFDPERPRGVDCPWEDDCPWYVDEGDTECFCSVGVTPELYLAKMLAARVQRDSKADN